MRVGIVGAGIAGLSAAREMKKSGVDAVVYERNAFVGGRARTVEQHGCIFDTGLQTYTPRGMSIEGTMLNELPTDELVLVARPVDLYVEGRAIPGSGEKNRIPRYTYRSGSIAFPKLLANGLDVRLSTNIEGIERSKQSFSIGTEEFDAIVLSAPIRESQRILATMGDGRNLANASYRPCISLVLGYDVPQPSVPFYALLAKERMSPCLWVGVESLKAPGRAPEGVTVLVVQFGPEYSRSHFASSEDSLTSVALATIKRIFGPAFAEPAWRYVERWEISQPERVVLFEGANRDARHIVVCGDGTAAGRAENAFESGIWAARLLLKNFQAAS